MRSMMFESYELKVIKAELHDCAIGGFWKDSFWILF